MGAAKKEAVVVKKIKPYPILTKLLKSETSPPIEGSILRITTLGFQIEFTQIGFAIGDLLWADFEIPLSQTKVHEKVKVVRTMDRYKDSKATIKSYLVEMHFIQLNPAISKVISEFTIAINQK